MAEIITNIHMHTHYSDGTGSHQDIAEAALQAGLDAVLVTDHNRVLKDQEGYYQDGDKRVLLLVGEEIHDTQRTPQKNHLLVFGADDSLAHLAEDPQELINHVRELQGICFLAHPIDPAAPAVGEPDISWVSWNVENYTGLELWNAFSEFKTRLHTKLHAIWYAYLPRRIARGPLPETLDLWDSLLNSGNKVSALGGSDAHALHASLGPLNKTLFPYAFHFQGVNTHLITPEGITGDQQQDTKHILQALSKGSCFIGYDLPASTRGFRFSGFSGSRQTGQGGQLNLVKSAKLIVDLPREADCRILKNGQVVHRSRDKTRIVYHTYQPGVYRVEVYLRYLGRMRGWIFSNPIYIQEELQ